MGESPGGPRSLPPRGSSPWAPQSWETARGQRPLRDCWPPRGVEGLRWDGAQVLPRHLVPVIGLSECLRTLFCSFFSSAWFDFNEDAFRKEDVGENLKLLIQERKSCLLCSSVAANQWVRACLPDCTAAPALGITSSPHVDVTPGPERQSNSPRVMGRIRPRPEAALPPTVPREPRETRPPMAPGCSTGKQNT